MVQRKIIWAFLTFFLFSFSYEKVNSISKSREKKMHRIVLSHPAYEDSLICELRETYDKQNRLVGFNMDVLSVYCAEHVCSVDTVHLFWNVMGQYLRYELPEGVTLEKNDGKPFVKQDYELLHEILNDENARFNKLSYNDIVKKNDVEHGLELDGYSGATIIAFDDGEAVKGAALTCYTLWHYVYGDVKSYMRRVAIEKTTEEKAVEYLLMDSLEFKIFAIEWFTKEHVYKPAISDMVLNEMLLYPQLIKIGIAYMEQLPVKLYQNVLYELCGSSVSEIRLAALKSMSGSLTQIEGRFMDDVFVLFKGADVYKELNLLFNIADQNNINSKASIELALSLLEKDIIVSRRAYYFLLNQTLNQKQNRVVQKYYVEYKSFL